MANKTLKIYIPKQARGDCDHPLEPNRVISIQEQQTLVKEKQFYVSFLENWTGR